jgi:hypothetical protein
MAATQTNWLSERSAKSTMLPLERLAPSVGEPLDYVDCALRYLPSVVRELLANRPKAAAAGALRERQPELWITDADVPTFLLGSFCTVMRMRPTAVWTKLSVRA